MNEQDRPDASPSSESTPPAAASMDERLKTDRPSKHGLPPDFGVEQPVMKIRPSFFRAKPIRVLVLFLVPLIAAAVATWLVGEGGGFGRGAMVLGIAAVVCWVPMAAWWFIATRSKGLEITNKRTIERRGLLSKSTDEVLHDHVRNVKVDQSFYQRIVKIGKIGIASSGSDDTEIIMEDLPDPQKIREIIDLYRPLD